MPDDSLSERLALAMSPALMLRVDDWRRTHPRIPSRAMAARMLIEIGLESGATPAAAPSGKTSRQTRRPRGQTSG